MFCFAKLDFSLAGALVVGGFSLLAVFLGKQIGAFLARAKGHHKSEEDIRRFDDWLAQISISDAKRRAERLLGDPELFDAALASTAASEDLLAKAPAEARDFLARYRNVCAQPFGDTEIGRDWLQLTTDGAAIYIGWSEYFGRLRMRLGDEQVYTDKPPHDHKPIARSIYHLLILLADADTEAVRERE